jgi:hypothetical protein
MKLVIEVIGQTMLEGTAQNTVFVHGAATIPK